MFSIDPSRRRCESLSDTAYRDDAVIIAGDVCDSLTTMEQVQRPCTEPPELLYATTLPACGNPGVLCAAKSTPMAVQLRTRMRAATTGAALLYGSLCARLLYARQP